MSAPHVVVVGAGLAGLSAALGAADGGARVTVLEARPRLGGATWSFERGGLDFDNGQHVYLRCCTAYRRFLERIGSADLAPLQARLEIPVLARREGRAPELAWIRRSPLPAPAHLLPSLARYRHLSVADRARSGLAVRAIQGLSLTDPALDSETFAEFLRRHRQSQRSIDALFDLIILPTTNLRSEEVSLAVAAKVFRTGLLDEPSAADLGWAQVPLGELHGTPAERSLSACGARIERRARVRAIRCATGENGERRALGVVLEDGELDADEVILAVTHEAAAEVLPEGTTVDPASLRGLGTSPIIDVHLVFDRTVSPYPLAAGLDSPVQYVFDRTRAAGLDPKDGQCLAISVSGADAEHGERPEVLIERFRTAITELFPAAATAQLLDAVVTREHAATFRALPGTSRLRPSTASGIAGLHLAGSWTDTGWPATMEGAVRSGNLAASAALARGLHRAAGAHRATSTFAAKSAQEVRV